MSVERRGSFTRRTAVEQRGARLCLRGVIPFGTKIGEAQLVITGVARLPLAISRGGSAMYLMYLDDSGSVNNKKEKNFVLSGVVLPENNLFWINKRMNDLAMQICPQAPETVEFHASEIYSPFGKEPWESMSREQRIATQKTVLEIVNSECQKSEACIFAAVVNKNDFVGSDPMKMSFETLCSRFDKFIKHCHIQHKNNKDKGLIIIDKSNAYESILQEMALGFKRSGTQWDEILQSIQEVPLFVDSKNSRAIQAADHIAYAVFRRYERGDSQYFDIIQSCFNRNGPRVVGLSHITKDKDCLCPSCLSKQFQENGKPDLL